MDSELEVYQSGESLYKEGEERFGYVSSLFYSFFSRFISGYHKEIVKDLEGEGFKTLLDVGSGPGSLAVILARSHPGASIYCVDPSPSMVSIARKRIAREGLGNRVFVLQGSSRKIPFNIKFDVIISSFSYHHWKDRDSSLPYLAGHLKNGGLIAIYEFHTSRGPFSTSHGISEEDWNGLEIEGFEKTVERKGGMISLKLRSRI
ncbi:MAG: class I SAM-dependent methyltransferase [Thermoplasmata archaeon]